jgi:hypothetical protein
MLDFLRGGEGLMGIVWRDGRRNGSEFMSLVVYAGWDSEY